MTKTGIQPLYVVDLHRQYQEDFATLHQALRYIGTKLNGSPFGCMNVTVKRAVLAGYSIRMV